MAQIDLTSHLDDVNKTITTAIDLIDNAQRTQKAAADKADKIMAPATLAGSEASSAKAIFQNIDEQQGALVSAGLDPEKVYGKLLNYAANLSNSAKSRLVSANTAAGV